MKAVVLNQPGGIENLVEKEIDTPQIQGNEVLVKVKAISINPVDVKTRKGLGTYGRIKEEQPIIIGWDISGEVVQVGNSVVKFQAGDEVFGMINFPGHGKGYAEFVAAPEDHLAIKPKAISHSEAAAGTLAALTAWQVLADQAKVKQGETVLIHAAAGGVGHFAVQIAKHLGATVVGTSSARHAEYLKSIGVDQHIDYTQLKFEEVLNDVDVILDPVGGDNLFRSLKALKKGGRLISIVGMSDEVKLKAQEEGKIASPYLVHSSGNDMERLATLYAKGIIKPKVMQEFSFKEMGKAHEQVESGRTQGKVVVVLE
jgi:NADPH:quinone reductase-like Zn-dependent oxidoreductase